jgi:hypothetical protein
MTTIICLEVAPKRAFASALEWPGWSRSGKTAEEAIATLADYAARYAPVAERAGTPLPGRAEENFEVVEELAGDGSTAYGVPGKVAAWERQAVDADEAKRLTALVVASWETLADVAVNAPRVLKKGPRGGGRDTDPIVEHVAAAELSYIRKLGIQGVKDSDQARQAIVKVLSQPSDAQPDVPKGWPARYAARRIAWHTLDHVWEIEDKS